MKRIFLPVSLLLCATYLSAQLNSRTYNFEMFLENAIQNYPAWLRDNKMDPSPATPTESLLLNTTRSFSYNMTLKIKEEQVIDYANQNNIWAFETEVDIERQFVYLKLSNKGALKYQGKYTVNGSLLSFNGNDTEYAGEGTWTYTIPEGVSENATYRFHVEESGFANITEGRKEYVIAPFGRGTDRQVEFTGFFNETEDFEEYEIDSISDEFVEEYELTRITQLYPEHPMLSQLDRYLVDIFGKTTFENITADK